MEAFLITEKDCIGAVESDTVPEIGGIFSYEDKEYVIVSKRYSPIYSDSEGEIPQTIVIMHEI